MSSPKRAFSPWLWVPTLYFAESIPNSTVTDAAVVMYTDLGVGAAQLGLITGWMYLPWVIKPLWSPFVDLVKTKRWWISAMQMALAACFFGLTLSLKSSSWLNLSAASLWLMAFFSATHDIACDGFYMLGLNESDQAKFTGVRTTFYKVAMLCAKGVLVYLAGHLMVTYSKAESWSLAMLAPALGFAVFSLYHMFLLPRPDSDRPTAPEEGQSGFLASYLESFSTFFSKPRILPTMAYLLLFRLGEAQLLAMVAPFLKGERAAGGLGITTEEYGVAYGVYGMAGGIVGGLLGGYVVSRWGLRRPYWPMIFTMHLPNLAFLYLAVTQPDGLWLVRGCLVLEQFGYGFGFTVYTLFLIFFANGPQKTSHFAIGTGFMAMSLMLPRMVSGYVKDALGFPGFFLYVLVCTLPSFAVAWWAWRNKDYLDYFPGEPA